MSAVQSFADLGVSNAVVSALSAEGINEPFAVQRLVIGDILAGRDVLTRSPTGSGKTLAFGIPLVDRIAADGPRPAALILAPTRELAAQITEDLGAIAHARALRVTAVYGGAGIVKQSTQASNSHIIVATPGRLEDLLARGAFRLDRIQVLILDEADRMLDMGFRPAVDRVVAACPRVRQTLFFSATLEGEAGEIAARYTTGAVRHEHGPSARRVTDLIEHRFISVTHAGRLDALVAELGRERDLALVFARTKHGADRLVKRMRTQGLEAAVMHGNKSQRQREQALARFEAWDVDTLVATDVAARGIDVSGISHVINFDPPGDRETYVHRIGRTGRAGHTGIGITLVGPEERRDMIAIARELGIEHGLDRAGSHRESPSSPGPSSAPRRDAEPAADREPPRPGAHREHAGPGNPRGRRNNRHRSSGRPGSGSSRPSAGSGSGRPGSGSGRPGSGSGRPSSGSGAGRSSSGAGRSGTGSASSNGNGNGNGAGASSGSAHTTPRRKAQHRKGQRPFTPAGR
jgi:ATP-dependent RNA helicase RhlE